MIPNQGSSNRRQSSILKFPRQCSVPASLISPNENTIALKKRRVSFAEKKHVKEYLNSDEGVTWVNTYEENDSSHSKCSTTANSENVTLCANTEHNYNTEYYVDQECENIQPNSLSYFQIENQVSSTVRNLQSHLEECVDTTETIGTAYNSVTTDKTPFLSDTQIQSSVFHPSFVDAVSKKGNIYKYPETSFSEIRLSTIGSQKLDDFNINSLHLENYAMEEMNLSSQCTDVDQIYYEYTPNDLLNVQNTPSMLNDSMEITTAVPHIAVDLTPMDEVNKSTSQSYIPALQQRFSENKENINFFNENVTPIPSILTSKRRSEDNENLHMPIKKPAIFQDNGMEITLSQINGFNSQDKLTFSTEKTTVFQNRDMEKTTVIPSIVEQKRHTSNLENVNISTEKTTIVQDDNTQVTTAIPSNILEQRRHTENLKDVNISAEKTIDFPDGGMEMTTTIPSIILEQRHYTRNLENVNISAKKNTDYKDDDMKMTTAIPSTSLSRAFENQENVNFPIDKYTFLQGYGFEITTSIPNISSTPNNTKKSLENVNVLDKETTDFRNHSMEITTAISNYPVQQRRRTKNLKNENMPAEKTAVFKDDGTNITTSISITPSLQVHGLENKENEYFPIEKTIVFQDHGMEITTTIPSASLEQRRYTKKLKHENMPAEKTTVFQDDGMEMTTAVSNTLSLYTCRSENKENDHVSIEKTTVFQDRCMELTTAISSIPIDQRQRTENLKNVNLVAEKTVLFRDDGMEMTTAVSNIPSLYMCRSENKKNEHVPIEKTTVFQDRCMELTTAISSIPVEQRQRTESLKNVSLAAEKTAVFRDNGMELTTAVSNISSLYKRRSENKENQYIPIEKTTVFQDHGMKITTAISSSIPVEQCRRTESLKNVNMPAETTAVLNNPSLQIHGLENKEMEHALIEKTTVFQDHSMEITTTVPSISFDQRRRIENLKNVNMPTERTSVFQDNIMEITTAISNNPSLQICELENRENEHVLIEKTTVFQDSGMEITTAIPNISFEQKRIENSNRFKMPPEKTAVFEDDGMEISTVVSNNSSMNTRRLENKEHEHFPTEKTTVFQDHCMDLTTVISRCPVEQRQRTETLMNMNMPVENTTVFRDDGMEITTAVSNTLSLEKRGLENNGNNNLPFEKTAVSAVRGIEMTATSLNIPTTEVYGFENQKYRNNVTEKNTVLQNCGMEITTAISSIPPVQIYNIENEKDGNNSTEKIIVSRDHGINTIAISSTSKTLSEEMKNVYMPSKKTGISEDRKMRRTISTSNFSLPHMSDLRNQENLNLEANETTVYQHKDDECSSFISSKRSVHEYETSKYVQKDKNSSVSKSDSLRNKFLEINAMDLDKEHQNISEKFIFAHDKCASNAPVKTISTLTNIHESDKKQNTSDENSASFTEENLQEHQDVQNHNINDFQIADTSSISIRKKCSQDNSEVSFVKFDTKAKLLKQIPTLHREFSEQVKDFDISQSSVNKSNRRTFVIHKNTLREIGPITEETTQSLKQISRSENEILNNSKSEHPRKTYVIQRSNEECFTELIKNPVSNEVECDNVRTKSVDERFVTILDKPSNDWEIPQFSSSEFISNIEAPSYLGESTLEDADESISVRHRSEITNHYDRVILETKHVLSQVIQMTKSYKNLYNHEENEEKGEDIVSQEHEHEIVDETLQSNKIGTVKDLTNTDPFSEMSTKLTSYEASDNCIWDIRRLDKKLLAVNFVSKSLVVIIYWKVWEEDNMRDIDRIRIESLLVDDCDENILSIAHRIILEKLDPLQLAKSHTLFEHVWNLLNTITEVVKEAMDFIFDLKKLSDIYLIDIENKRASFKLLSERVEIIVKITIDLKEFQQIQPDDVEVECLLGNVNTKDIKELIQRVRKDNKYLRRYIGDVQSYINLMADRN